MPEGSRSKMTTHMIKYNNRKLIYLFVFVAISVMILSLSFGSNNGANNALVAAKKQTDILFLKGKFILKDKKGSIVISDEKKCHCPHYFR